MNKPTNQFQDVPQLEFWLPPAPQRYVCATGLAGLAGHFSPPPNLTATWAASDPGFPSARRSAGVVHGSCPQSHPWHSRLNQSLGWRNSEGKCWTGTCCGKWSWFPVMGHTYNWLIVTGSSSRSKCISECLVTYGSCPKCPKRDALNEPFWLGNMCGMGIKPS